MSIMFYVQFAIVLLCILLGARVGGIGLGVLGWAQVNGRNALSWDEKFAHDIWYIDHYSFWLDMKILFLTVKKVFIKEGISAEGEATMPYFTGNNTDAKK